MIPLSSIIQLMYKRVKAVMLTNNQYDCFEMFAACFYTEIDVSDSVDDSTLGNVHTMQLHYTEAYLKSKY